MNIKAKDERKTFLIGLFALLTSLLTTGCGTPGKNMPVTEATSVIGADQVQEVRVEVNSFYFKPSRIIVAVNRPVRLIFSSKTLIIPHNFSIQAADAGMNIDKDIGAGKTVAVEFTPTKTGEYEFYCDKDGHHKKGMQGILVVREQ
jgi:plastocyanin domain-containing protein